MKIVLGSDHAGFELKEKIKQKLQSKGLVIDDRGTHSADSCDYPDYAQAVCDEVAAQEPTSAYWSAVPELECRSPPTRCLGFVPPAW